MPKRIAAPVSVVIPCYRCSDTVVRAVASVFAQTWRPAEVILVDGHSGDDTLSRLRALEGEYPAGWIQVLPLPENDGPGTARNAGWEHASQPHVAFLDADAAWHSEDYLLWSEICMDGHACYWSALPLAFPYKAAYGEGGLSGNLGLMEKGELDWYARLRKSGPIGLVEFTLLWGMSFVKYFKRLAAVGVRNIGS